MKNDRGNPAEKVGATIEPGKEKSFFAVSPLMLFPDTSPEFRVYLNQGGKYVLYTREQDSFDDTTRRNLFDLGITKVFVPAEQRGLYDVYLEANLGRILDNSAIPLEQRSQTFYSAATAILEDVFRSRLPEALSKKLFARVMAFVQESVRFLSSEESLKSLAKLISHDYRTFTHSVHVYTYALAMFNSYGLAHEDCVRAGLGAMLHDIGKARVPRSILEEAGPLTEDELAKLRMHPIHGVAMCSMLPLTQESVNVVLFHHERFDGKGYPTGTPGSAIPLPVRIVSVCNVYDNLTTNRPGQRALRPFEALKRMREDMHGAFDVDVYKRLVLVLSGAEIV
ncbi:metal dependent phosphohydrolase [Desulfovibrio sp. X2]|uniref:HD-GYP domain-containing protein n=1 Tax=Desulfovibrio sp. X2 TaxID=941449 RepID=UPI0003587BB4|nr:HD domain-containing phosphohydrolase [Desulfovibrio sp. X2]EPR39824.1 metal dependent phosphohydrolase [Desulfovibrio sp. X2]